MPRYGVPGGKSSWRTLFFVIFYPCSLPVPSHRMRQAKADGERILALWSPPAFACCAPHGSLARPLCGGWVGLCGQRDEVQGHTNNQTGERLCMKSK